MPDTFAQKPRSKQWRPDLTRLPEITEKRLRARRWWRCFARWLVRWLIQVEVSGLENFPEKGPALIVVNHLGDADIIVGLAYFPVLPDAIAKAELHDYPLLGKLMDAYGVIWVHRGQPDRRTLRAALQALNEGRMIGLAPEGRQSVTGTLEEGTGGAAYLALKSGEMRKQPIPIVPVAFTGTENSNVFGSLRHLRRGRVTMSVGSVFYINEYQHLERRMAIHQGTEKIMRSLARLLPDEYQGAYANNV